jgi:hypothetical protein
VTRFWKRGNAPLDLEAELRTYRPAPRRELVEAIVAQTHEPSPRRGLRVAVAAGITAVLIASLGAFGGLGYAATGAGNAAKAAKRAVAGSESKRVVEKSAASNQYGKKCGHTPATDQPPRDKGSTKPAPGTPPGNPDNDTCPGTSGPKK